MNKVNPRRPLDRLESGYRESDVDFVKNNLDLCLAMLDGSQASVSEWLKKEMQEAGVTTPTEQALYVIGRFGGIDGGHHKQWVLDQAVRMLTGAEYPEWVAKQKDGEDGPDTYEWDEGIAP